MKTVTIYTDGIKTALRFYAEMSVLLALIRATAEHDKQAPSGRCGACCNKSTSKELL